MTFGTIKTNILEHKWKQKQKHCDFFISNLFLQTSLANRQRILFVKCHYKIWQANFYCCVMDNLYYHQSWDYGQPSYSLDKLLLEIQNTKRKGFLKYKHFQIRSKQTFFKNLIGSNTILFNGEMDMMPFCQKLHQQLWRFPYCFLVLIRGKRRKKTSYFSSSSQNLSK